MNIIRVQIINETMFRKPLLFPIDAIQFKTITIKVDDASIKQICRLVEFLHATVKATVVVFPVSRGLPRKEAALHKWMGDYTALTSNRDA